MSNNSTNNFVLEPESVWLEHPFVYETNFVSKQVNEIVENNENKSEEFIIQYEWKVYNEQEFIDLTIASFLSVYPNFQELLSLSKKKGFNEKVELKIQEFINKTIKQWSFKYLQNLINNFGKYLSIDLDKNLFLEWLNKSLYENYNKKLVNGQLGRQANKFDSLKSWLDFSKTYNLDIDLKELENIVNVFIENLSNYEDLSNLIWIIKDYSININYNLIQKYLNKSLEKWNIKDINMLFNIVEKFNIIISIDINLFQNCINNNIENLLSDNYYLIKDFLNNLDKHKITLNNDIFENKINEYLEKNDLYYLSWYLVLLNDWGIKVYFNEDIFSKKVNEYINDYEWWTFDNLERIFKIIEKYWILINSEQKLFTEKMNYFLENWKLYNIEDLLILMKKYNINIDNKPFEKIINDYIDVGNLFYLEKILELIKKYGIVILGDSYKSKIVESLEKFYDLITLLKLIVDFNLDVDIQVIIKIINKLINDSIKNDWSNFLYLLKVMDIYSIKLDEIDININEYLNNNTENKEIDKDIFIKILNIIKNKELTIKKLFNYLLKKYDPKNFWFDKIEKYISLFERLNNSPSQEIQRLKSEISDLLTNYNYEEANEILNQIEDIFIRNHLPNFWKVFKVFEFIHDKNSLKQKLSNNQVSPFLYSKQKLLNKKSWENSIKNIFYSDLLKSFAYSNNRDLKEYIELLKSWEYLLNKYENHEDLEENEQNQFHNFLIQLAILYNSKKWNDSIKYEWLENDDLYTLIKDNLLLQNWESVENKLSNDFLVIT